MKYQTINELDNRIEKIISQTVKHYYTDWKNYDRPKYMTFKGSKSADDKKIVLLVRESGTYLVRTADVLNKDEWANTLYEYFQTQDRSDYYLIDIAKLTCKKILPTLHKTELKTA